MNESFTLHHGNCLDVLKTIPNNLIDSIVTDPPYELGFMGKSWDSTGIAYNVEVWLQCFRVLKPGGHLLAFGGSRTYHRLAVAIEDAGFQIRDQIMWVYGSGFPKSLNVSKAIDKQAGLERQVLAEHHRQGRSGGILGTPVAIVRQITAPATDAAKQWDGWGTALKPAHEPIVMARKPLDGTVANNVLAHGTGALNIDGSRVGSEGGTFKASKPEGTSNGIYGEGINGTVEIGQLNSGRWPANFIHDGSDEVLELFPDATGQSAARFFYCAKANKKDRNEGLDEFQERLKIGYSYSNEANDPANGMFKDRNTISKNFHPTVKPLDLMRYLVRMVTPPNGTVLDPFTGSGSTGKAAMYEGFTFIGVEQSAEYVAIATARITHATQTKPNTTLFDKQDDNT